MQGWFDDGSNAVEIDLGQLDDDKLRTLSQYCDAHDVGGGGGNGGGNDGGHVGGNDGGNGGGNGGGDGESGPDDGA